MSAISLKSITGITSITTPAGVDDQLTLHNNNTTEAVKLDIAGNVHINNHLAVAGITTINGGKLAIGNVVPSKMLELYSGSTVASMYESAGAAYVEQQFKNSSRHYILGIRPETSHAFCIMDNSSGSGGVLLKASGHTVTLDHDLNVDGHTNLDNVSVAGVSTNASTTYFDNQVYWRNGGSNKMFTLSNNGGMNWQDDVKAEFGNSGDLKIYNVSSENHIYGATSQPIIFSTNTDERLRINSNGDVTTTGQASFNRQNAGFTARAGDSVSITRASGTPLELNRTGSDGQMIALIDDNSIEASIGLSSGSLVIGLPNSNSERLRIKSNGNIGVNNDDPQRILHVGKSGTAEANIRIQGGSDYAEIRVKDSDNNLSFHHNVGGAGSRELFNSNGSTGHFSINCYSYQALTITTNENGTNGPEIQLMHNTASPAANDIIGQLRFSGKDSAGNTEIYSKIETKVDDPTSGSETGHLNFATRGLGSFANVFRIKRRSTASAPSYTADDADGVILDIYNTGNPYPRYMNFIAKSAGNTDSNIGFYTEVVGGSPIERLRIAANGEVVISPQNGGSSNNRTSIHFNNSAHTPFIAFKTNNLTEAAYIRVPETNGGADLNIRTKNTSGTLLSRLTLKNDGSIVTHQLAGNEKGYPLVMGTATVAQNTQMSGSFNYHDFMCASTGGGNNYQIGGWVYLGNDYGPNPYPARRFQIAKPGGFSNGTIVYQVWHNGDSNYYHGGLWEIRINCWTGSSRFESVSLRCINGSRDDLRVVAYNDSKGIMIQTSSIWGQVFLRRAGWDDGGRNPGSNYCAVANNGPLATYNSQGTDDGAMPSGGVDLYAFDGTSGSASATHTGGYYIENGSYFDG